MAPSPTVLLSTSLDRYARVHSTYPPPAEAGQAQNNKGAVLEKAYMASMPTCVIWDGVVTVNEDVDADDGGDDAMQQGGSDSDGEDADEDVWEAMQVVQDGED
jgi:ribosome biogenesis protein NSA1